MLFMLGAAEWIQIIQLIGILGTTIVQVAQTISIIKLLDNITNGSWLLEQIRKIGLEFDQILISLADKVYYYFQQLVSGTLITKSVTDSIMSKIYIVIGVVIFFKLAIISIKYMINPEQFLDDKLGAQTLVKRIILGALIIILIPMIFSTANKLQHAIIEDRVIEKIILPNEAYKELTKNNHPGKELAMTVFLGFFTWNGAVPRDSAPRVYNAYDRVITYGDISSFSKKHMTHKVGEEYVISYVPILTTLAVGYLLFMLISYAMEVAFRSFKLFFMQLISPFVIVNYMLDPSKEDVLKKWVNVTISTYLLIFIRVITIWFATLICYYLTNKIPLDSGETSLLNTDDGLLKALIIIGLFAFLKDLPKIISEIFGYNLQENETINGIMNQGVGVLKGFAVGKVGLGFAKQQMGYNIASSALGGVSNMSGSIASTMTKMQGQNKGKIALSSIGNAGADLGSMGSSITSTMGSTLSSSMSSSILSPITQAGGVAANADKSYHPGHFGTFESNDSEQNKEENPKINSSQYNDFVSNMFNNDRFTQYIEGDKISLQNKLSSLVDENGKNRVINNPVVELMSKEIYNKANCNEDVSIASITSKINNIVSSLGKDNFTIGDINNIMDTVTLDITSKKEASNINTKNNNNLIKGTDASGFENIILPKK